MAGSIDDAHLHIHRRAARQRTADACVLLAIQLPPQAIIEELTIRPR